MTWRDFIELLFAGYVLLVLYRHKQAIIWLDRKKMNK